MRIMHHVARSLVTIGAAAAFLGAGTFAAFTSQTTNAGNSFSSGTLVISADSDPVTPGIQSSALFTATNIAPAYSETKELVIVNEGTLALKYDGTNSNSSGDGGLYAALMLKVGTTSGAGDEYSGPLSGFTGFTGGVRTLASGASESLFFTIELPSGVSDPALQGKTTGVLFTFDATQ